MIYYMGVPNSAKKAEIVAREPIEIIEVQPEQMTLDCQRHIQFLREYSESFDPRKVLQSEYATWLLRTRSEVDTLNKCKRFITLLNTMQNDRGGPWGKILYGNIKLDGSHRAAIAVHLRKKIIPVAVMPILMKDFLWIEKVSKIVAQKHHDLL